MTGPQQVPKLSVEEYFAFEENAQVRHEYVNGSIFAMTGASAGHNTISLNIAAFLRNTLKGSGCQVFIADMKVRAEAANCFYYPDVMVACGSVDRGDYYTATPTIIFEVLSKSTAAVDRREKLVAYQMIPSLQSYVIVHQSRKRIEHYQRADVEWTVQELVGNETICLGCKTGDLSQLQIPIAEIYADIDYDESPDWQVHEDVEVYSW